MGISFKIFQLKVTEINHVRFKYKWSFCREYLLGHTISGKIREPSLGETNPKRIMKLPSLQNGTVSRTFLGHFSWCCFYFVPHVMLRADVCALSKHGVWLLLPQSPVKMNTLRSLLVCSKAWDRYTSLRGFQSCSHVLDTEVRTMRPWHF